MQHTIFSISRCVERMNEFAFKESTPKKYATAFFEGAEIIQHMLKQQKLIDRVSMFVVTLEGTVSAPIIAVSDRMLAELICSDLQNNPNSIYLSKALEALKCDRLPEDTQFCFHEIPYYYLP